MINNNRYGDFDKVELMQYELLIEELEEKVAPIGLSQGGQNLWGGGGWG